MGDDDKQKITTEVYAKAFLYQLSNVSFPRKERGSVYDRIVGKYLDTMFNWAEYQIVQAASQFNVEKLTFF